MKTFNILHYNYYAYYCITFLFTRSSSN